MTVATKTVADMTAIVVARASEIERSELLSGNETVWGRMLAPFGLALDDEGCARGLASEVMDAVIVILCRHRGVEIDL